MYEAYRNATVTIVAAASSSTTAGIFATRNLARSCAMIWNTPVHERCAGAPQTSEQVNQPMVQKVFIRAGGHEVLKTFNLESEAGVLYTRGWALQESLLSPRILTYEAGQLTWQCSTLIADENGYRYNPKDLLEKSRYSPAPEQTSSTVRWKSLKWDFP
jgi:hypothetical protein